MTQERLDFKYLDNDSKNLARHNFYQNLKNIMEYSAINENWDEIKSPLDDLIVLQNHTYIKTGNLA